MHIPNIRYQLYFVCGLMCTFGLTGCPPNFWTQKTVSQQEQAASVHVAVLSVARWADYREAMQPTFKLTPDDAVGQALPTTLALEEKFLESFSARLKLAVPGPSLTDSSTTSPSGSQTATALPPSTSVLGTSLSIDPLMKYWAATALYQEVQLLNRYVKDAALYEGYTAYVVRLQVSLMPRMRNEPYDAYSTISFFSGGFGSETGSGASSTIVNPASTHSSNDKAQTSVKGIRVIPLLVTDDIEAAINSRSLDKLRQLGLALSATIQGVGVGTDLQSADEKLRTVLGRDFNSRFIVAQVSENTLYCRFGAVSQAQSGYAMIPTTHNVTLLVLVPCTKAISDNVSDRTVRLVAKTILTDVIKGDNLQGRTEDDVFSSLIEILINDQIIDKGKDLSKDQGYTEQMHKILQCAAANDYSGFKEILQRLKTLKDKGNVHYPESIWVEVTSIRHGSQLMSATFLVPQRKSPGFPIIQNQNPVLFDDGKDFSVVKLVGGVGLESDKLAAVLTTPNGKNLAHSDIKVSNGGKEIEIKFPSLSAYNLEKEQPKSQPPKTPNPAGAAPPTVESAGAKDCKSCKLIIYDLEKKVGDKKVLETDYLYAPEPRKPGFDITTHANLINTDKEGKAKLSIVFWNKNKSDESNTSDIGEILFNVKGADVQIEQVAGGPTVKLGKDDGWTVSGLGVVNLNLSNLNPISPVTISAKNKRDNVTVPLSPVVLPVLCLTCGQPEGKK